MKRCAYCAGKFGLIRHRWYQRQFCSKKCRDQFLEKLAADRERVRRWLRFLQPNHGLPQR
jgi:endogenous inhibitor of DNA gyrase (YacG/DUF329 family)